MDNLNDLFDIEAISIAFKDKAAAEDSNEYDNEDLIPLSVIRQNKTKKNTWTYICLHTATREDVLLDAVPTRNQAEQNGYALGNENATSVILFSQ